MASSESGGFENENPESGYEFRLNKTRRPAWTTRANGVLFRFHVPGPEE